MHILQKRGHQAVAEACSEAHHISADVPEQQHYLVPGGVARALTPVSWIQLPAVRLMTRRTSTKTLFA